MIRSAMIEKYRWTNRKKLRHVQIQISPPPELQNYSCLQNLKALDVNIHLRLPQLLLNWKSRAQSHSEIAHHFKIPKSSVTTILHPQARQSEHPLQPSVRPGRPHELDARAQRATIRHLEKFPHDNLNAYQLPLNPAIPLVRRQYGGT